MECLQIRCIDGGTDLFGEVVSEKTGVIESPAVDVVDQQDSNIFVCSGHIGIVVRKLRLFPHGCSAPFEARQATR